MIKLKTYPQHSDRFSVSYGAVGSVLKVTVDGITDEFDFAGIVDGVVSDFASDALPVMPLVTAKATEGTVLVTAVEFIPGRPVRGTEESKEGYQARLDSWIASQQVKEVTL
ncbi:hypothetical protein [Salinicola sp. RZ23]|uniref:hypothetical protein n=1 Tax=Salinicola sp. RZ23 TaxID=1949087 RepID=UPI000DA1348D|nr:hypothetical protein [Salinicola sp. RZ23]